MKYFPLFVEKKIMARYHPPKNITNNQAPMYTADLAYEAHGKCGCQTIILSDLAEEEPSTRWEATNPGAQPEIAGCEDYSHVYRIVALSNVKFRTVEATNIAEMQLLALVFGTGGFKLMTGSEILGNFTKIEILSGTLMLYRDCDQS
tara:strand:+ start:152 stop:592 length:441 start_codon:yes stop_codon:yes gene_type:complete